jgi:hypothetical protein
MLAIRGSKLIRPMAFRRVSAGMAAGKTLSAGRVYAKRERNPTLRSGSLRVNFRAKTGKPCHKRSVTYLTHHKYKYRFWLGEVSAAPEGTGRCLFDAPDPHVASEYPPNGFIAVNRKFTGSKQAPPVWVSTSLYGANPRSLLF